MLKSLTEDLTKHAAYFDSLISSIPHRFYLPPAQEKDSRFIHNKRASPGTFDSLKIAKSLARKEKFEPEPKSTVDIQKEVNSVTMEAAHLDLAAGSESQSQSQALNIGSVRQASSIGELKERLNARIEQLQMKRMGSHVRSSSPHDRQKGREQILQDRRNRKLEQEKKQNDRKNNHAMSKVDGVKSLGSLKRGASEDTGANDQTFNRVEFNERQKEKKQKIDPKVALKKVETEKFKLEKLSQENPEKAKALKLDHEWNKSIAMASGEKVYDDERKLKKTIKKREKKKEKSKDAWEDRKDSLQRAIDKRQAQRQNNLKERSEGKKTKRQRKNKKGF